MPIVDFTISDRYPEATIQRLLEGATQTYSSVLDSPPERIRANVHTLPDRHRAIGGVIGRQDDGPSFTCLAFEGRPQEMYHALLAGFTDLLVEVLDCPRDLVRGRVQRVDPNDWGIAGQPASVVRKAEVEARRAAQ